MGKVVSGLLNDAIWFKQTANGSIISNIAGERTKQCFGNQLCKHTAPPVVLFVICLSYRIIIAYMYTILLAKRYCTFAGVVIKCICKIVFP